MCKYLFRLCLHIDTLCELTYTLYIRPQKSTIKQFTLLPINQRDLPKHVLLVYIPTLATLTFCKYLRSNIEQRRDTTTEWESDLWFTLKSNFINRAISALQTFVLSILILKQSIYPVFIQLQKYIYMYISYTLYSTNNTIIPRAW